MSQLPITLKIAFVPLSLYFISRANCYTLVIIIQKKTSCSSSSCNSLLGVEINKINKIIVTVTRGDVSGQTCRLHKRSELVNSRSEMHALVLFNFMTEQRRKGREEKSLQGPKMQKLKMLGNEKSSLPREQWHSVAYCSIVGHI